MGGGLELAWRAAETKTQNAVEVCRMYGFAWPPVDTKGHQDTSFFEVGAQSPTSRWKKPGNRISGTSTPRAKTPNHGPGAAVFSKSGRGLRLIFVIMAVRRKGGGYAFLWSDAACYY